MLQYLASAVSRTNKFSLVLLLQDWDRKSKAYRAPIVNINSSTAFWDQVYSCVKYLAVGTVMHYGLETVIAVIRENMKDMLFLINWNISSLGSLFKEMQRGTWVVSHHREMELRTSDWKVLKIRPFTEHHVIALLRKFSHGRDSDIIQLYKDCGYKDILTSPDIVKVFCELRSSVHFDTDFELLKEFVDSKVKIKNWENSDIKNTVIKLGEIAFGALKKGNNIVYRDNELNHIDSATRYAFLVTHDESGGFRFIHSTVQEFLAAIYVFHQPYKACKEWLSNVFNFKRVFKFACGMWCRPTKGQQSTRVTLSDRVMKFLEEYLVELFDIKALKKSKGNPSVEPMEVEGQRPKTKKESPKGSENPYKDPFSHWDYLMEVDDVCQGQPEILDLFVKLLSSSKCWSFNMNTLDDRKMKRISIIIKKVKLSEESPVTIKLESSQNIINIVKMWNKLKNMESLQKHSSVSIFIAQGKEFHLAERENLIMLCNSIVSAYCHVYITSYNGPLLCSKIPDLLKCNSFLKLNTIDVIVYDFASLYEILKCDYLTHLEYISVTVELIETEQYLSDIKPFKIPEHSSLKLRIKYFDNIQKLFDIAQHPENLCSLSIYDVYVREDFKLSLTKFKNVESLSLIFEPCSKDQHCSVSKRSLTDEHLHQGVSYEGMEVEENPPVVTFKQKVPRHNWMLRITVDVLPPARLNRLLLRNMDFYNNTNNYMLLSILEKYNIHKLIILDSQLSLKGVKRVLSSQAGNRNDVETVTKKFKNSNLHATEPHNVLKKPRLSTEERDQRRKMKPKGKEIIITSDMELCQVCNVFPCLCPNSDEVDNLDDLVTVVEDVYQYDIVNFSYTNQVVTVRKDVCGDVRIQCALPALDDKTANDLASGDTSSNKLLSALNVAQSICLEQTNLTFKGTKTVIDCLKDVKSKRSVAGIIEPFSLTVRSSHHPNDDDSVVKFMETIQRENIFTSFSFWCTCENTCYKIRKTYAGKMIFNDSVQELNENV